MESQLRRAKKIEQQTTSVVGRIIPPAARFCTGNSATIECERLPEPIRRPEASHVPCLGRLSVGVLLEYSAARGRLTLVAPDRCADCPEGGASMPPGEKARTEVSRLLGEAGLGTLAPILIRTPLGKLARDDRPARLRARRGFLRRIVRGAAPRVASASRDLLADRMAALAALKQLALAHGAGLPASFFPALTAGARCAGHGVCVATCATGALRWFESDGRRGVEFDAERCTACGECVDRCPERALQLNAGGNGTVPSASERLSSHSLRTCAQCEDDFIADGDDERCPACRKGVGLFQDLAAAARERASANQGF